MTMVKYLIGGAGFAALAAAAPASAQYYAPYGNAYGYRAMNTQAAVDRCHASTQWRQSAFRARSRTKPARPMSNAQEPSFPTP